MSTGVNFCKHPAGSCSGTLTGMSALLRDHGRPLVLGHRGAPTKAPENTLAGFEAAAEDGADGVELDVQATSEAAMVVIHDPTLERTTDRVGAVAQLALADVLAADAGWAFVTDGTHPFRGRGIGVPQLDDVLDMAAARGLLVDVEVKAADASAPAFAIAVAERVRERGDTDAVFLSSFSVAAMAAVAHAVPEVSTALICAAWEPLQALTAALAAGCRGLHPDHPTLTRAGAAEVVAAAHAEGCWVAPWTVDDVDDAARLAAAEVDALITDVPAAVRAALG